MVVTVSGLLANCPGLVHFHKHKRAPFQVQNICNKIPFNDGNSVRFPCPRVASIAGIRDLPAGLRWEKKCVNSVGRDYQQLSNDGNDTIHDPFWLSLVKEAIWALKFVFMFLVEQPSQLKYLEWPSFRSTLKTATLTLILVALLIVVLSSIDSVLSFLLAYFLRRTM